ncbi:hypothetical protein BC831DRAFT_442856 [Entophlyctis helioformis]|nr:hypothetical protein BC831DRAFT_442856 [Entophlyctis helioformis]
MPVKQAAPPSAPETPAQQPPMILVQRLSTNAVVSYPTRSGLALIAEAIGAPMGDCTSVFVSSAPLPSDSAASRMGTGMLPKRYPRRLPTRAVYTTADYGGEPRLRAEMASDTAHFRAVLRLMDPLPASPATSGSSRPALELWFRGGSVQSFLVERYHIVDGDRDGDGDRMTMQSSYRREFTSMFSPASSSPPSALSESDALDGFWHDVASGFGAKMARFCEYWSHMAEYDPSVQDPAGAEQAGRHRPHYNLAGRFQSDQTWQ